MKRVIRIMLIMLIVLFMFSGLVQAQEQKKQENSEASSRDEKVAILSYTLKYVSPDVVHLTLKPYIYKSSYSNEGNMITVTLPKENIATFEKLLNQLDVEKQKVMLRIFTVIASKEAKNSSVGNSDLQKVLFELAKVLSFKSFNMDGVSALTLTDGQRNSELLLSSHIPLALDMRDISIRNDGTGQTVGFRFKLRQKADPNAKEGTPDFQTLIESETSIKENGYLVAGVSKIGTNGDSLVLVINVQKQ